MKRVRVIIGQVARAAGIAEGTIFRVFAGELLDAVMAEAMRHDHAVREISSISLDQPPADRLAEAADALGAYLGRMGTIAGALHESGHRRQRGEEGRRPPAGAREVSMAAIREALAELFAPSSCGSPANRPPRSSSACCSTARSSSARWRSTPPTWSPSSCTERSRRTAQGERAPRTAGRTVLGRDVPPCGAPPPTWPLSRTA
ncbi:TetR/AcrR family transcriptional regulator [Streptomyces spinosisporus]|uniref:TetR family transcriptional regulator n=1 Tax=Streptomyces spinosisporus TaxID=2927582 RepID=A0ABS9XMI9_9ACTN|nr:hypothetical protein [Streptomyces spinosisporus]MCI3242526.1 hypothetical protein [Streptomyces spinosisporus]